MGEADAASRVPTRVYLTVDVECREERRMRGRVLAAAGYDLRVFCRFANQSQEFGIGFIASELERYRFPGTFFVEPLGSGHFGADGLAEACRTLLDRGHDVQLHAHPIQAQPLWLSRGERPAPDDLASYTEDEQVRLLGAALALLVAAGVPRDSITAFRAGNFGADNRTWPALRRAGLSLSSSYNPCYFERNCRMRWGSPVPDLFATDTPGVWELPITCLAEGEGRYRHLQIAAVSARETIDALEQARALGIGHVTIVTHSFEFSYLDSTESRSGRPNARNIERLRALLRFLDARRESFEVEAVGTLVRRLARGDRPASRVEEHPRGRTFLRMARHVEQLGKRLAAGRG
jgi:hypothetical protein